MTDDEKAEQSDLPKLDHHELSTARRRIAELTAERSILDNKLTFATGQVDTLRQALLRADATPGKEGARARRTARLQGAACGALLCGALGGLLALRTLQHPPIPPHPAQAVATEPTPHPTHTPPPKRLDEAELAPPLVPDGTAQGGDRKAPTGPPPPLPAVQRPNQTATSWPYRTPMGTGWRMQRTPWPDKLDLLVEVTPTALAVFRIERTMADLGRPELDRRVESLKALVPTTGLEGAIFVVGHDGTVRRSS